MLLLGDESQQRREEAEWRDATGRGPAGVPARAPGELPRSADQVVHHVAERGLVHVGKQRMRPAHAIQALSQ